MRGLLLIGVLLIQGNAPAPTGNGVIGGRLTLADGTPAAATTVTVELVPEPGRAPATPFERSARTNEAGAFRMTGLPAGRYLIRTGTGNLTTYYPGVPASNAAATVIVAAGATVDGLAFAMSPAATGFRVSGHVTNLQSQPDQGQLPATPMVVQLSGAPAPQRPVAADGTFEFLRVRPGTYSIVARAPGAQSLSITVSDRDLSGIELTVPPLIAVSGTVAVDRGAARPRISLIFNGAYRGNAQIQPDGTFATALPPGEYRIAMDGLPAGYYVKSIAAGSTDLVTNTLKIAATDSTPRVTIALGTSTGVKVSGRLTSPKETTISTAQKIAIIAAITSQTIEAPVSKDGSFELTGVMPGTYSARVSFIQGLPTPPVTLLVSTTELRDVEFGIPSPKEIQGRAATVGNGPPPKFTLLLVRGSEENVKQLGLGELTSMSPATLNALTSITNATQVISVTVAPLPDGSFRMTLPQGEYRVVTTAWPGASLAGAGPNGFAPGYSLRSMTYGPANLLVEPMNITELESPELLVDFNTVAFNPWVKVTGRVRGQDPAKGPYRVALESRTTATLEVQVHSDGSFEFPQVLQGTAYTARLLPVNRAANSPNINVGEKDIAGVEILVPREKEVTGRVTVAGGGTAPGFMLTLRGPQGSASGSLNVLVKPEPGGSFKVKLPQDERRVSIESHPLGYRVESITYGATDLRRQPLMVGDSDSSELRVAFLTDGSIPPTDLRGRVTGLDPERDAGRIALHGVTAVATFETSVHADGSFEFAKIPQGTYVPALLGGSFSGLLNPSSIVVSGNSIASIEIAAPRQSANSARPPIDETPTGTTVVDMAAGQSSRGAANESAAVANLRTINTAEVTYLSASGGNYGSLPAMIEAGLLDSRFNGAMSGYTYSIIAIGADYAAAATPVGLDSARYGFYSTPDGVVRYSLADIIAPSGLSGNPVQ